MKIGVGQVFALSSAGVRSGHPDYRRLTCGRFSKGADINKGIWAYRSVIDRKGQSRRPAVILLSKGIEAVSESNPWVDIVEPDRGYALFHGDNRTPRRSPFEARGNKILLDLHPYYFEADRRILAPPILLFTQVEVDGKRKGYRAFAGYGVPRRYMLQTQASPAGDKRFINLTVELVLFGLEHEAGGFDWEWIDRRRDEQCTSEETLRRAPAAWRRWVKDGEVSLEACRMVVARSRIERKGAQLNLSKEEGNIVQGVYAYYQDSKHSFEGLASLVSNRVMGEHCWRGWVTKRSGDGGIDFVSKLDVGAGFSRTSAVVLGQAKCVRPENPISGRDVARLVARLRRGWIATFVTTGYFSEAVQVELHEDQYPVVLINGKTLAVEVQKELAETGLTLEELLNREDEWYRSGLRHADPAAILIEGQVSSVGPPEHVLP